MASPRKGSPGRAGLGRATAAGRRAWPVVIMAWERWQALSEEDRARYRRRVREYADRGRRAVEDARSRRSGRRRS
jgi:hypothetical protein